MYSLFDAILICILKACSMLVVDVEQCAVVEYTKAIFILKGSSIMSNPLYGEILEILENDAKTKPEDIAAMTGASVVEVNKAIAKLEADKVILKYTAVINREKTEAEEAEALIEVKAVPKRGHGYDDLAERIYKFSEVQSVYLMSGTYDLAVIVRTSGMKQISQFVFEKLAVLDGVASTVTHFIMRKYKEHGIIFTEKEEKERLVVSP
jgi:DNA-binding Lrp family transcriptional regulator